MSSQNRQSDPVALRRIWKAIDVIRGQRQIANIARLTKVIQRDHPYRAKDIMQHILQAIQDNMVIETLSLGCKGSKAGLEQEGYWVPEGSDIHKMRGTSDCYCFVCHKPGKLLNCNGCNKVYHKDCNDTYLPPQYAKNLTFRCQFCSQKKIGIPLTLEKKQELNRCLQFIARRATEAVTVLALQPCPDDFMHYKYFIWDHQTLKLLVDDCIRQKFENTCDFERQLNVILHNCVILEGEQSALTKEAKKMVDICSRELKELELCNNCYLLSSTKPSRNWFCMPCNPPHKVVWAKQKGFEYWPAKVIQIAEGKIDVRFFGGHHERAWVTLQCIKCITISPAELHIKKSKGWIKASEEMKQYLAQTEALLGRQCAKSIVEFIKPKYCEAKVGNETENDGKHKPKELAIQEANIKHVASTNEMEVDSSMPCTSKSIVNKQCKFPESKQSCDEENMESDPHFSNSKNCVVSKRNGEHTQKYRRRALLKRKGEECNCRRIYSRKLFFYQSSVRRMRLKERKNNLMISARFIHQYLKKHSDRIVAIQNDNIRLQAENTELKTKLNTLQSK